MMEHENFFTGKIGVVGAGALGGYYGARLFHAGNDVHFLMRSDAAAVRAAGLRVHSVDGDFTIQPPVYEDTADLGPCRLVLVGLKATQNDALAKLLPPLLGPDTLVLTLQNGLGNEEVIARVMEEAGAPAPAAGRILGGTAFLCSTRRAPGIIDHTDHGWIRLAEMRGAAQPRTRAIAAMFQAAGVRCEVSDSLVHIRWEKLVWNIPYNGLGVGAWRADTQAIMEDGELRRTIAALMEEVLTAAQADGVAIEPALPARMLANTGSMGAYRTSMQVDFELGRALEVEAILGEPVRRARAAGLNVPRLEMLYGLVRRLDRLRQEGRINL